MLPTSIAGPRGWPLLGQAFSIDWRHQDRTYTTWSRRYGPILKATAGWETLIVLSDPDLIREAFNGPLAAARQTAPGLDLMYADKGMMFTSGELWHRSRRFTLFHLRNFGMGKSKSIELIQDQINDFMSEVLAPNEGQPRSLDWTLNIAVMNILWALVAGEISSVKDTRVMQIIEKQDEFTRKAGLFFLLANVPALMKLPERITGISKIREIFHYPIDHLLQPALDSHRRSVDLDGEPRDYIDCLLQEQSRQPGALHRPAPAALHPGPVHRRLRHDLQHTALGLLLPVSATRTSSSDSTTRSAAWSAETGRRRSRTRRDCPTRRRS